MDDWARIRQLFSTGQHSKREIGRLVGVWRGTVDRALESDRLPKYQRTATGSSFDVFAAQVRVLLVAMPRMAASTLAEQVGWSGSASVFREKVAGIRPEYVRPDPADRFVHEPGKQAQCDLWFPHEPLPLGHGQEGTPPVLVMTSTFSGFFQAIMLPSRSTPDLLGGMWSLLQTAQAVPPAAALGQRDRYRPGQTHRTRDRVRGHVGHRDQAAQGPRSGVQGHGRAAQPVLPLLVHAGPALRVAAGFQRANEPLAAWNSTDEAPNSSSKSSPNGKRTTPSRSPRTSPSPAGRKPSPTRGSAPRSLTDSPSTAPSSRQAPIPIGSRTRGKASLPAPLQ